MYSQCIATAMRPQKRFVNVLRVLASLSLECSVLKTAPHNRLQHKEEVLKSFLLCTQIHVCLVFLCKSAPWWVKIFKEKLHLRMSRAIPKSGKCR